MRPDKSLALFILNLAMKLGFKLIFSLFTDCVDVNASA